MRAGDDLHAFADGMGKVATPVIRKFISPVTKQVGKSLQQVTIPQTGHIEARTKPNGKILTEIAKKDKHQLRWQVLKNSRTPPQQGLEQQPMS